MNFEVMQTWLSDLKGNICKLTIQTDTLLNASKFAKLSDSMDNNHREYTCYTDRYNLWTKYNVHEVREYPDFRVTSIARFENYLSKLHSKCSLPK